MKAVRQNKDCVSDEFLGISISEISLLVADHVVVMLAYWDKNEICRFANDSFSSYFGIPREEMIDRMTFNDIFGQEKDGQSVVYFRKALQGNKVMFDQEVVNASGAKCCCSVRYFPNVSEGKVVGVFAQIEDITQRKMTEKSIKERNEILERMFETTHFGMVYLDLNFDFIRVNKSYADSCGHPVEFFPGKNHFDLYPGEEVERIFRQVAASGKPYTILARPFEFPDHPEWGVTYWDWSLYPTRGADDNIEGLLFILLDVTESKRAEIRLKDSQSALVALTRHMEDVREKERKQIALDLHDQLGQELTGINIGLQCLCKELPLATEDLIDKIKSMIAGVNGAISTVRHISMKLRPAILDDLGLIPAIDWFQKDFEKRTGVKCKLISFTESLVVSPEQEINIFRIIQETFTNIARHSGATRAEITISKHKNGFLIAVEDNGRGISDEEKNRVDSFGLQGMHARAHTCGGELTIESVAGQGTRISLLIPNISIVI